MELSSKAEESPPTHAHANWMAAGISAFKMDNKRRGEGRGIRRTRIGGRDLAISTAPISLPSNRSYSTTNNNKRGIIQEWR
jgi:hypothetical protein